MSSMTIRNIDDDLKARLRIRAAEHGRSMEAEVRDILKTALDRPSSQNGIGTWIHEQFAELGGLEIDIPCRDESPRYVTFDE